MARFELSAGVDANKIFLVNYSALADRYDPAFYKEMPNVSHFVKLSTVAYVKGGKRIPLGKTYSPTETPYLYLRVTDVGKDGEVNYTSLNFIDEDVFHELQRYEIHKGQLAISIAGTIGRVLLLENAPKEKRIILTENCAKIILRSDAISPRYFSLVLNLPVTQKQFELNYIQTTIPKLGLDRIKNLYLPPIPDLTTQKNIVSFYQKKYSQKQQKEHQAQTLLEGIDAYLLAELGITLPEQDNRIEKRMFTVPFHKITGWRLDAPVQRSSFSLLSSKYPMARLIKEFEFNPNTNITSQFCSFIPMEKISDNEGVIVSSKETLFKDDAAGYTRFAENDLLWARITPCMQNGKSAVATSLVNGFGYGSTEYFVFRASKGNNIHYLHALLRTKYVRNAAMFYFGGATGHQRVSLDFFNSMMIPLPPLDKQNEIAAHISDIRAQAKQLQQEAAQILAEAKAEIERLILGKAR